MLLRHLALAVTDEARSQAFYAGWFGFEDSARMDDGVLMLYGPGDVSLALGPAEGPPTLRPRRLRGRGGVGAERVEALTQPLER